MKVAVFARGFAGWGGGVDFLRVLCSSLALVAKDRNLKLMLVLPGDGPLCRMAAVKAMVPGVMLSLARAEMPKLGWPGVPDPAAVNRDFRDIFGIEVPTFTVDSGRWPLAHLLRRTGADVLFPVIRSLGPSFPVPWIGYLPDFQHRYLSHLFTQADIDQREQEFGRMLNEARVVVVNSKAVAADVARFHPQARARIVTLPFAPSVDAQWLQPRPELLDAHAMQTPYFLISNQFWQHKDHATAIEAMRLVRPLYPDVSLVCSGDIRDHRNPDHFSQLMAVVEASGLGGHVRIMGRLPKREQIEIMKGALAVIQPTLFEGGPGGGAVYDAVGLGVPAIVSDIPINREIDEPRVIFFKTGNAQDLAAKMADALRTPPNRPDDALLIAAGSRRRASLGNAIADVLESATN